MIGGEEEAGEDSVFLSRDRKATGGRGGLGQTSGSGVPGKKAWQPTPVFLPGEVQGQRSLAGYSP